MTEERMISVEMAVVALERDVAAVLDLLRDPEARPALDIEAGNLADASRRLADAVHFLTQREAA